MTIDAATIDAATIVAALNRKLATEREGLVN
jgi:hypothetical protein